MSARMVSCSLVLVCAMWLAACSSGADEGRG